MREVAVLGELLDAGRRHADAAEDAPVQDHTDLAGVLRELRRLVTVMASYQDAVPEDPSAPGPPARRWEHGAAQQREYLLHSFRS